MSAAYSQKRRHIRYAPDKLDYALIMYRDTGSGFVPDDVALIIDEAAMSGAQIAARRSTTTRVGDRVVVKLGQLEPLPAVVVWQRDVDPDLCRFGLKFLE